MCRDKCRDMCRDISRDMCRDVCRDVCTDMCRAVVRNLSADMCRIGDMSAENAYRDDYGHVYRVLYRRVRHVYSHEYGHVCRHVYGTCKWVERDDLDALPFALEHRAETAVRDARDDLDIVACHHEALHRRVDPLAAVCVVVQQPLVHIRVWTLDGHVDGPVGWTCVWTCTWTCVWKCTWTTYTDMFTPNLCYRHGYRHMTDIQCLRHGPMPLQTCVWTCVWTCAHVHSTRDAVGDAFLVVQCLTCTDMRIHICIDMSTDISMDTCTDVRTDMRTDMCTDKSIGMCVRGAALSWLWPSALRPRARR